MVLGSERLDGSSGPPHAGSTTATVRTSTAAGSPRGTAASHARPARSAGDDRRDAGDHDQEPERGVEDRAPDGHLRELALLGGMRLTAHRAAGACTGDRGGADALGVVMAADQRVDVRHEQRGAHGRNQLPEDVVVERGDDHGAIVGACAPDGPAPCPNGGPAPCPNGPTGRSRHACGTNMDVRLLVANCSVEYAGRLGARLPAAPRLIVLKADGSVAVHADAKAYKPLNWMSPPCTLHEEATRLVCTSPGGECLTIELHEVLHDYVIELGDDPGLAKDGVEAELQELIARRVAALRDDFRLVRREYPTDIGPVDLLCRDGDDNAVVVEVKRVGEIAGVEQLLRYQERLDLDPSLAPTRGVFVATRIKPQARVFAQSRGVTCVEIDLDELRAGAPADLRLF